MCLPLEGTWQGRELRASKWRETHGYTETMKRTEISADLLCYFGEMVVK